MMTVLHIFDEATGAAGVLELAFVFLSTVSVLGLHLALLRLFNTGRRDSLNQDLIEWDALRSLRKARARRARH